MLRSKPTRRTDVTVLPAKTPALLLADLRELIMQAREGVARAVDSGLVTLYWHVGQRIRQDILKEKRAEYGKRIVHALGALLTAESPLGVILCAGKNDQHVELLNPEKNGIHIASYRTEALPKAVLE
ncbi:MAG: DUF1016 N-terminal domain-containing protein [Candidatus Wallbacteria bacterium]|nr:DUF1016 N-terminal domain-containing protein [Candidatus Wallbacteria bacterium]